MKKIALVVSLFSGVLFTSVSYAQCHATASNTGQEASVASINAVENQKIVVVVNTANWCGTCQKNGPRVEGEILSKYMNDSRFTIIKNDLTDDATKASSKAMLEKAGVSEVTNDLKYTGIIYFIDPVEKRVIDSVGVAKDNDKIIAAFEKFKG